MVQLSRYVIVVLFSLYTFYCFRAFRGKNKERQERVFRAQRVLMFTLHFVCSAVLVVEQKSVNYIILYALEVFFFIIAIKVYELFYRGLSKLVLNNMMMTFMIGFIMLGRISYHYAYRQFILAAISMGICLFIPFLIKKIRFLPRLGWQYALLGILLLLLVFVIGVEKYGAKNWISVGGVELQPSEFVKILFVFFAAALLSLRKDFKYIVIVTSFAALHVVILVVEKDLGGALIYFFTYLMILFVATGRLLYLGSGLLGGTAAAIIAYKLFAHVRVRVVAWKNPWSVINDEGYQIAQSIFGICMGGLFGMGLGKGAPTNVPVAESDFIFSGICEEFGILFALCLMLIYISSFIMFINIALKMKKEFYKLTAFGLSVVYIFQVFLCMGGAIKFIPSTGVTLPLISYGGSSVFSTVILYSVIQGMYVLNSAQQGEETDENEEEKQSIKS